MAAIHDLLARMGTEKGSDLFVTVGVPPSMKVNGGLQGLAEDALDEDQARSLVLSTMTDEQQAAYLAGHEANFAIVLDNGARFRVSAFFQRGQCGMVVRRIETAIPTLSELALPPVIADLAMTKRGLILFVGGTGTGKSTSLAAMIGHRNASAPGHILTIEDPVEYVHPHLKCIVNQREVGVDTASFEEGLKNALRQAPDVVLIGEIRSREIMDYAVAFAETGHLALATLHANNANQALDRIINFFPSDRREQLLMDLSLNLKAVVAQQLIPTPDGQGRVAAQEILINTPLVQDKIRAGEVHELQAIMQQSKEQGMQTFDGHLYELYQSGRISYESALAHADSANEVRLMAKLGDGDSPTPPGGTPPPSSSTDFSLVDN